MVFSTWFWGAAAGTFACHLWVRDGKRIKDPFEGSNSIGVYQMPGHGYPGEKHSVPVPSGKALPPLLRGWISKLLTSCPFTRTASVPTLVLNCLPTPSFPSFGGLPKKSLYSGSLGWGVGGFVNQERRWTAWSTVSGEHTTVPRAFIACLQML